MCALPKLYMLARVSIKSCAACVKLASKLSIFLMFKSPKRQPDANAAMHTLSDSSCNKLESLLTESDGSLALRHTQLLHTILPDKVS